MTEQHFSTYLTMELIGSYTPKALTNIQEPEIKLWLCPVTMMPVFSAADYGGPTGAQGCLPIIGYPTVHIRVPHVSIESPDDDAVVKELLFMVYTQIRQQIHLLELPKKLGRNLENAMTAKQKQIDILTTLFRQKENVIDSEIVH